MSNTGTIYLNNSDTFITQPLCLNGSPNCVNGNTFTVITRTPQYPNRSFFRGPVANQQYLMHNGLLFTNPAYAPTYPDFAHEFQPLLIFLLAELDREASQQEHIASLWLAKIHRVYPA